MDREKYIQTKLVDCVEKRISYFFCIIYTFSLATIQFLLRSIT